MIALALLAGCWVWGFALLRLLGVALHRMERLVVAPVVGLATGSWLLYIVAARFGSLDLPAVVTTLTIFVGAAIGSRFRPQPGRDEVPRWFVILAAVLLAVLIAFNLFAVLGPGSGGALMATEHVWADTPFHTSLVTSFAYRDVYPPDYPVVLGQALNYPFLVDYLSGAMLRYGLGLRGSFVVINVLVHAGLFLGVAIIVRRLSGSARAAVVAVIVLFALGNFGWIAIPHDVGEAGGFGAWLRNVPWSYTGDSGGVGGRERLGMGLYLANPVFIHLLPRRSAAFGMAVGTTLLLLLDDMFRTRARSTAVVVGMVAGVMPRVHAHSAMMVAIAGAAWVGYEVVVARRERREVVRALAIVLVIAGVVAAVIALPEVRQLTQGTEQFFAFWPGWIGQVREAWTGVGLSGAPKAIGVTLAFWVLNGGLLLLLVPIALMRGTVAIRRWYLPFVFVWLFGFFIRTQPWDWDNNNHFIWWQVGTVVVVAPLLASWLGSRTTLRFAGGAAVVAICLGGILTFVFAAEHRMHLWSSGEVAFAEDVRRLTPSDAVILTSGGHTHPINGLAGRQVVMGYWGWLSTRGLDSASYERNVQSMLSGNTTLMRELGVDYVVLGPWEEGLATEKNFELSDVFRDRQRFDVVINRVIEGREWRLLHIRG